MLTKEEYMRMAIDEARKSGVDVPVGAVVVERASGIILARAHNEKEVRKLTTAHAEMVAIERASGVRESWYLDGCDIYVTLEPCCMCAGAIVNARLDNLYFGTYDKRFGACGTLYNIPVDSRLNHRVNVEGGILETECAELLTSFFKGLRQKPSKK